MASIAGILDDDPLCIADIGAAMVGDTAPPYQGLIDSGKARLIAFEPDAKALQALREKYPPPHLCLPHFVGDGRPATYYETNWGPTGSLFEPNRPLLELFQHLAEITEVVGKHRIDTTRLDDIPEIDDIDFLKIDVQGSERAIFAGCPRIMGGVTLIHTEINFVEMYKGMPLFSDIDRQLRVMGFQWHFLEGVGQRSFRPFSNPENMHGAFKQQLWGDAVYVRDWMAFDRLPAHKLLKLAVLLHDLYDSYDLAHLAMLCADRQLGTCHAEHYAKWL
jgi:FkbM family methyltransferase